MGRLRALALFVVLLAVGAFLGSAISQRWTVAEAEGASGGAFAVRRVQERVRVEVRNGGGLAGMARSATDRLRDGGFDVVYYGNANTFDRDSSVVIDRVGRLDLARAVADHLGVTRVVSEPDSNLYLDVTVVLGQDWAAPAETSGAATANGLPWWDPRGWWDGQDAVPAGPVVDPPPEDG